MKIGSESKRQIYKEQKILDGGEEKSYYKERSEGSISQDIGVLHYIAEHRQEQDPFKRVNDPVRVGVNQLLLLPLLE